MGEVLPFLGRYFGVRDWTAAERAQIQTLAKSLDLKAAGIEVVYGASDAGDPWCVIKDAQENVLIHVARIGASVVVHDMVADLVREGRELWLALERRLADDVLPSSEASAADVELGRREAQLMLALTTASAFGLEPHAWATTPVAALAAVASAETDEDLPRLAAANPQAPAAPVENETDDLAPSSGRATAPSGEAQGSAAAAYQGREEPDAAQPPAEAPLLAMPDAPAKVEVSGPVTILAGGVGDDTLVGTSAAEVISGGAGDDVLIGGGAPAGQVDVLDGGAGDDRIVVQSDVVASGGTGADTFVVETPDQSGVSSTNLGVIVDFDELSGDKVKFDTAYQVTITSITPVDDVLAGAANAASLLTNGASVPGERVGVDVDGDGVEDGYVLVAVQRGRVILGHGELGQDTSGADADIPANGSAELAVGASIWISSEII